jgi:hypothetical protein
MLNDIRPLRSPVADPGVRGPAASPRPPTKDPFFDVMSLDRLQPAVRPLLAQPVVIALPPTDRTTPAVGGDSGLYSSAPTPRIEGPETATRSQAEEEELTTTYKVVNGFFVGTTKAPFFGGRTTTKTTAGVAPVTPSGEFSAPGVVGRRAGCPVYCTVYAVVLSFRRCVRYVSPDVSIKGRKSSYMNRQTQ